MQNQNDLNIVFWNSCGTHRGLICVFKTTTLNSLFVYSTQMRIKEINIKKYGRFHNFTIDLGENPKKIIALVGPNGCGKSCVFDAMLQYFRLYTGTVIGETRVYRMEKQLNLDGGHLSMDNIQIEFAEGSMQSVFKELQTTGRKTIFVLRSPHRYNADLNVKESKSINAIGLNDYGASTTLDIDEKMETNYRRLKIKYDKYLNAQDCKPSEAKQHIIGKLNQSIRSCLDIELESLGNIEDGKGTLFFKKKGQTDSFSFNVLSSGEKEVIDLLSDLYLRQEEYAESIFLIDEPELHLNTAIQKKMLIEINRLVGEKSQIWVATHSIGFLRALQENLKDDSDIISFTEDKKYFSETVNLVPIRKNHKEWTSIFSTALDDLTGLVSPRRIIYCEGAAEPRSGSEQGMDAQAYNNIFGETYPDTLFVSSGGNTELDQRSAIAISILSKVFPDLEIWILKDRDMASGKAVSEEGRQEYLRLNQKNHRVLKRWEIENYLFDKEVVRKYCENKDESFDEKTYDKNITDILSGDVKSKIQYIRNICNVVGSVDNNLFKIDLSKFISTDMQVYKELEQSIFERK